MHLGCTSLPNFLAHSLHSRVSAHDFGAHLAPKGLGMHKHLLFLLSVIISCLFSSSSSADVNTDSVTSESQRAKEAFVEAQAFFHSTDGLNLDLPSALERARQWSSRKECESGRYIRKVIAIEFKRTYEGIRTFGRVGLSSEVARSFASDHVAHLTQCGDLIRL